MGILVTVLLILMVVSTVVMLSALVVSSRSQSYVDKALEEISIRERLQTNEPEYPELNTAQHRRNLDMDDASEPQDTHQSPSELGRESRHDYSQ